jgi:hypothetical protein
MERIVLGKLDENVVYEWGKLYEQYKAGKKATGGEITKLK